MNTKFMSLILEDMFEDKMYDILNDDLEEAYCFLSGSKSSFEMLDDCLKEEN